MAILLPFPKDLVALLETGPHEGDTHNWIWRAALRLHGMVKPTGIFKILRKIIDKHTTHRVIPDREILDAINKTNDAVATDYTPAFKFPTVNHSAMEMILNTIKPLCPIERITSGQTAIERLFRNDELVCFGVDTMSPIIGPAKEVGPLANKTQFIVPNPMKGTMGKTKTGKDSPRCQSNVLARKYLVAEFDFKEIPKIEQSKLVRFLAGKMKLAMVVDSGGKSLHAWFHIEGKSDKDIHRFFCLAVTVGADKSRFDPCGWVRMPGGSRGDIEQRVVYLWE